MVEAEGTGWIEPIDDIEVQEGVGIAAESGGIDHCGNGECHFLASRKERHLLAGVDA